jgi:hypothetical protein
MHVSIQRGVNEQALIQLLSLTSTMIGFTKRLCFKALECRVQYSPKWGKKVKAACAPPPSRNESG